MYYIVPNLPSDRFLSWYTWLILIFIVFWYGYVY